MSYTYTCEQCGGTASLCVSDWGYIAALCATCLKDRKNYMPLPRADALGTPMFSESRAAAEA